MAHGQETLAQQRQRVVERVAVWGGSLFCNMRDALSDWAELKRRLRRRGQPGGPEEFGPNKCIRHRAPSGTDAKRWSAWSVCRHPQAGTRAAHGVCRIRRGPGARFPPQNEYSRPAVAPW